jgi:23S rRNA (uracil1939-C5)-methyltransferase
MNIDCIHFKNCSGCQLRLDVDVPPILKMAQEFFSLRGIKDFVCVTGPTTAWRMRSKLATRGSSSFPLIGLFKERTHEVVEIPMCVVHHPVINHVVKLVKEQIVAHRVVPYNEKEGELRYLQCVVERRTQKAQLALVVNAKDWTSSAVHKIEDLAASLVANAPHLWHSIWMNLNATQENRIFGEPWKLFHGEHFLWEKICETPVCFLPASFGQANLDLFEQMVSEIRSIVPAQSKIIEFYAGVGVIGLVLAPQAKWVKCIEINPEAKICFNEAILQMPLSDAKKIDYLLRAASESQAHQSLFEADIVIVDPPRKGVDKELLALLKESNSIKKLIYVSCGWKAFERDADELLKAGWRIQQAKAYLFFPGNDYLETLAVFEK